MDNINSAIQIAQTEELGSNSTTTIEASTQANPATQPSGMEQGFMSFLPLILIFIVFYFMLIRPQMKKQKEHQKMVDDLKKGDKVVLSNGFIATIIKIEDNHYIQAEIAQNVKVRMLRSAVSDIYKEPKPTGNDKDQQPTEKLAEKIEKEDK